MLLALPARPCQLPLRYDPVPNRWIPYLARRSGRLAASLSRASSSKGPVAGIHHLCRLPQAAIPEFVEQTLGKKRAEMYLAQQD